MSDKEIILLCKYCFYQKIITVNTDAIRKWANGKVIQEAFPELSVEERELLISQTCGKCWDKMWKEDE